MGNKAELHNNQLYRKQVILLFSVFVIATCGLIYELVAGTLASYLLGDSVTQFSTIIGAYLFSMGIGSWLSKYIDGNLLRWFVIIELLVGVVGGCSAPLLFLLFEHVASFRVLLYTFVSLTGILVGLEIPLLMRILTDKLEFKELVARVFTFDYIGALLASLIFPLVLVPNLGLIRSSLIFGVLNSLVALLVLHRFDEAKNYKKLYTGIVALVVIGLGMLFYKANAIMKYSEQLAYQDKVIYAKNTTYQRIVLTKNTRELRLFLNGNLQFSSADEYRYHEALVHPAMQALSNRSQILILGGGDGLAVRELLKYKDVQHIDLVDLDAGMTQLFKSNAMLTALNKNSLRSSKLTITNDDAFKWLQKCVQKYDCIIIDFPDPSNYSVGKLYTSKFYAEVRRVLKDDGVMVVQSTSPYVARKSYWCISHTLNDVGFYTIPYHVNVPSFGEWGYVLAMTTPHWRMTNNFPAGLRFVDAASLKAMLSFPPDMAEVPTEVNRLNNQVLVKYFEDEWAPYQH